MSATRAALALVIFAYPDVSAGAEARAFGSVDEVSGRPAQVELGAAARVEVSVLDAGPTVTHARRGGQADTTLGAEAHARPRHDLGLTLAGGGATDASLYARWYAAVALALETDRDFDVGASYRRFGAGIDANVYAFAVGYRPDPRLSLRAATWISPGKPGDAGAVFVTARGALLEGRLFGSAGYAHGATRETPRSRQDLEILRADGATATLGGQLGPVTAELSGSWTREDRGRDRGLDHRALDVSVSLAF